MKAYFTKTFYGLAPADESSRQWFEKLKAGETVKVEVNRVRNYRFLKKYFALLNIAFENWEPGEVSSKYGKPEKNFDRFRADITILSGYFDTTVRLDGSVRIEPKSISFTQMSEEEFEQLYSKTIDVLIKHVYRGSTQKDVNEIVNRYLEFA